MDVLAPALSVVFEMLGVVAWVALGVTLAIGIAYYAFLFTYYKRNLQSKTGISVKTKAIRAAVALAIALVLIVVLLVVSPIVQEIYAGRVV